MALREAPEESLLYDTEQATIRTKMLCATSQHIIEHEYIAVSQLMSQQHFC